MVRAFDSKEVTHVEDTIDPERDLETITSELCKKDLQYVLQQREAREKDVKKNPLMVCSRFLRNNLNVGSSGLTRSFSFSIPSEITASVFHSL
jgi:ribosome-binding ATPase YchF (GTP1/OBG family)